MSSSSSNCNCEIELKLVSLGGCGCGIEISNGVAYSVGSQYINFTNFIDNCACVLNVLINNQSPPVFVRDGDIINVDIEIDEYECDYICEKLIYCDCSVSFSPYSFIKKNNKFFIRLSPQYLKSIYYQKLNNPPK